VRQSQDSVLHKFPDVFVPELVGSLLTWDWLGLGSLIIFLLGKEIIYRCVPPMVKEYICSGERVHGQEH
jgi:hypothetical protein